VYDGRHGFHLEGGIWPVEWLATAVEVTTKLGSR